MDSRQWAPIYPLNIIRTLKMPVTQIVISNKNVSILKKRAKKLAKEKNLSHHEALDKVAKDAGFKHWHHICECNEPCKEGEKAFKSGCIIAFDIKDGMDLINIDNKRIKEETYILTEIIRNDLYEIFLNIPDEDDEEERPIKETTDEYDLKEWFQDDLDNIVLCRLKHDKKLNINEVISIAKEYSFFPPVFIWLNGKYLNTYNIPATDEDGEIVGIRM